MPKPPPKKRSIGSRQKPDFEIEENNDNFDFVMIPNADDFDSDSDSENKDENIEWSSLNEPIIPTSSYHQVIDSYSDDQKKWKPDHVYEWINGEKSYSEELKNECLLSEAVHKRIHNFSLTALFELFFSDALKSFIIDARICNSYDLSRRDFDIFLGIIILSIFNPRKSQRDYSSSHPLLAAKHLKK